MKYKYNSLNIMHLVLILVVITKKVKYLKILNPIIMIDHGQFTDYTSYGEHVR